MSADAWLTFVPFEGGVRLGSLEKAAISPPFYLSAHQRIRPDARTRAACRHKKNYRAYFRINRNLACLSKKDGRYYPMADEIQKDRSPRCPRIPLEEALKLVKELHEKIGKSSVKVEAAWPALGFNSDNGAVTKILASLNQYGLIDRKTGDVAIAPLAIQILHPISDAQRQMALQKAALFSNVFVRIRKEFDGCDEGVLANQLIQLKFTPAGAKRTAEIYKANVKFAPLDLIDPKNLVFEETADENTKASRVSKQKGKEAEATGKSVTREKSVILGGFDMMFSNLSPKKKTLPVPLGSGDTIQVPYPISRMIFFS